MKIEGKVSIVLLDNIDTDIIYPGRFLNITDKKETAGHLFELVYPEYRSELTGNDIIVAGANFGCGSSRKQAATAIKYSNIRVVIAESFARIFYRNALNIGLPLLSLKESNKKIHKGDELFVDLNNAVIENKTSHEKFNFPKLDTYALELLQEGGLIPRLQKKFLSLRG